MIRKVAFDLAQDRPFDLAQDRPFNLVQDRLKEMKRREKEKKRKQVICIRNSIRLAE